MDRREALQKTALILGYAISVPVLTGVMNGCKAKPALTYKPVFFNEEQARLISDVAETIIPKTTTPGAKDTGVPAFIDGMVNDVFTKPEQEKFIAGLTAFSEAAKAKYGNDFTDCDLVQQKEFLLQQNESALREAQNPERPFMLLMKELTLIGYFTSQPGATEVLQYEQVPGPFQGCVPLAQVGKTWAT